MAFQFLHIESYGFQRSSRAKKEKWTIPDVLGEVTRQPGHCDHVEVPKVPVHVYGVLTPDQIIPEINRRKEVVEHARKALVRKDAQLMLAGVASYPASAPVGDYDGWERETIGFLVEEFGEALVCVLRHEDETYLHLHFYAIPAVDSFSIRSIHPGVRAREAAARAVKGGSEADRKARQNAYVSAMKAFLDRYFSRVSSLYGMSRTGPRRRRLTRAEWKEEQRQLKLLSEARKQLEQDVAALESRLAQLSRQTD